MEISFASLPGCMICRPAVAKQRDKSRAETQAVMQRELSGVYGYRASDGLICHVIK